MSDIHLARLACNGFSRVSIGEDSYLARYTPRVMLHFVSKSKRETVLTLLELDARATMVFCWLRTGEEAVAFVKRYG